MPELPEVETVARTLAPQVCGRRITDVTVLNAGDSEQSFEMDWPWETCTDLVSGQKFTPVDGRLILKLGPYEGLLLG